MDAPSVKTMHQMCLLPPAQHGAPIHVLLLCPLSLQLFHAKNSSSAFMARRPFCIATMCSSLILSCFFLSTPKVLTKFPPAPTSAC